VKRPFHRGAARLALATGAPIVPVCLTGTRGVPRPWQHRHTTITVGEPIGVEPARPTVAAAKALTAQIEERLVGGAP
jgi:1-acyl-sn-glycerol-3-phosphate acyltransferase